jgi:MFS family permease
MQPEPSPSSGLSGLSRHNKIILTGVCVAFLTYGIMYALAAPFLPAKALEKGVDAGGVGLILAAYEFGQLVMSPFTGYLVPLMGFKNSITVACLMFGLSSVAFGAVTLLPDGIIFLCVCIFLRLLTAAGVSVLINSGMCIVMTEGFASCVVIAFVSLIHHVIFEVSNY